MLMKSLHQANIDMQNAKVKTVPVYLVIFTTSRLVPCGISADFNRPFSSSHSEQAHCPLRVATMLLYSSEARLFSLVYVLDSLRAHNVMQVGQSTIRDVELINQLCLHLWFNLCILTYSILEIPQTKNAMESQAYAQCGSFEVRSHMQDLH